LLVAIFRRLSDVTLLFIHVWVVRSDLQCARRSVQIFAGRVWRGRYFVVVNFCYCLSSVLKGLTLLRTISSGHLYAISVSRGTLVVFPRAFYFFCGYCGAWFKGSCFVWSAQPQFMGLASARAPSGLHCMWTVRTRA